MQQPWRKFFPRKIDWRNILVAGGTFLRHKSKSAVRDNKTICEQPSRRPIESLGRVGSACLDALEDGILDFHSLPIWNRSVFSSIRFALTF